MSYDVYPTAFQWFGNFWTCLKKRIPTSMRCPVLQNSLLLPDAVYCSMYINMVKNWTTKLPPCNCNNVAAVCKTIMTLSSWPHWVEKNDSAMFNKYMYLIASQAVIQEAQRHIDGCTFRILTRNSQGSTMIQSTFLTIIFLSHSGCFVVSWLIDANCSTFREFNKKGALRGVNATSTSVSWHSPDISPQQNYSTVILRGWVTNLKKINISAPACDSWYHRESSKRKHSKLGDWAMSGFMQNFWRCRRCLPTTYHLIHVWKLLYKTFPTNTTKYQETFWKTRVNMGKQNTKSGELFVASIKCPGGMVPNTLPVCFNNDTSCSVQTNTCNQ